MENTNSNQPETLPNSTTVLVLGILSIFPGVGCFGFVGVVLGIITLITAKKIRVEIENNPGKYTETSIKAYNSGRICGIIGLSLSCLSMILFALYVFFFIYAFAWASAFGFGLMNY